MDITMSLLVFSNVFEILVLLLLLTLYFQRKKVKNKIVARNLSKIKSQIDS
jgi:hypothetical protein